MNRWRSTLHDSVTFIIHIQSFIIFPCWSFWIDRLLTQISSQGCCADLSAWNENVSHRHPVSSAEIQWNGDNLAYWISIDCCLFAVVRTKLLGECCLVIQSDLIAGKGCELFTFPDSLSAIRDSHCRKIRYFNLNMFSQLRCHIPSRLLLPSKHLREIPDHSNPTPQMVSVNIFFNLTILMFITCYNSEHSWIHKIRHVKIGSSNLLKNETNPMLTRMIYQRNVIGMDG
jgi:hypothetical protein